MDYILIDAQPSTEDASSGHGWFVPYGLAILAQELNRNGYTGKVLLDRTEYQSFISQASGRSAPKMIGVSASSWSRFDAIDKIKECRGLFPDALIVAGGFHFGSCAEDSIRNIPELDVVVRGDGEEVIVALMQHALNKTGLGETKGITYRGGNGQPIEQGANAVVKNLPDLGFLDQFFTKQAFEANPLHPDMPIPSMNVLAGRGCPHNCIFCSVGRTKYRPYPPEQVVDLISRVTSSYGIKGVKFWDDSLTIRKSHVIELCEGIKRRGLEIFWFCDSRADIDLDLIPLMHSAGCRFISVGLESGSPTIQKIVDKKISNEDILKFAAKCHEVGIRPFIFLIAGFPDEGPDELEMTIEIAKELSQKYRARAGSMGILTILPGTRLEQIARERGLLPATFSWARPYNNPENSEYGQSPLMPIYNEGLSAQMLREANRIIQANYASSMSPAEFAKSVLENLCRRDLSLLEKIAIGKKVFVSKVKMLVGG
ncbi:MAG: B12-binding domain-containing radical SAM protein [Desulfomonile tiedjei]|nr:B12-binding domain-containing radical SAM protein [Desulfomonile tiedjei]